MMLLIILFHFLGFVQNRQHKTVHASSTTSAQTKVKIVSLLGETVEHGVQFLNL